MKYVIGQPNPNPTPFDVQPLYGLGRDDALAMPSRTFDTLARAAIVACIIPSSLALSGCGWDSQADAALLESSTQTAQSALLLAPWSTTVDGESSYDVGYDAAFGSKGASAFVVGTVGKAAAGAVLANLWLRRYAPDGSSGWVFEGSGPHGAAGHAVAVHPSGDAVVGGFLVVKDRGYPGVKSASRLARSLRVWRINGKGEVVWNHAMANLAVGEASSDAYQLTRIVDVELDSDSNVVALAQVHDGKAATVLVQKLNAAGELLWEYSAEATETVAELHHLAIGRSDVVTLLDGNKLTLLASASGALLFEYDLDVDLPAATLSDLAYDSTGDLHLCGSAEVGAGTVGVLAKIGKTQLVSGESKLAIAVTKSKKQGFFLRIALDRFDRIYTAGAASHPELPPRFSVLQHGKKSPMGWAELSGDLTAPWAHNVALGLDVATSPWGTHVLGTGLVSNIDTQVDLAVLGSDAL